MSDDDDDCTMTPFDPALLWARIEADLRGRGWSYAKLAEKAGIAEKTLQRWRNGETVPQIGRLREVAAALGTTYEKLTEGLPRRISPTETLDAEATPVPCDPFDPWKYAEGGTFVGRIATMQSLAEALEQRRSSNVVGDRRIGKTSVLKAWERRAREKGATVAFASGENTSGLSARALVMAITGTRAPEDADGAADALIAWIRARRRNGATPLILVDEFDGLALKVDNRFFQRLRGMVGDGMVVLVLATCKHLGELCVPGHTSPFENLLETHQLGLLEPEAVDQLIELRPGTFAPAEAELLRFWCGRHPFYLKLLAHHVITARDRRRTNEHAVEEFCISAGRELARLWSDHLRPPEQLALRDVVRGETFSKPPPASWEKAVRRLRRRGVLTEEGKPFAEVLARWMAELT